MARRIFPRKPAGPLITGRCKVCGIELVRNHLWRTATPEIRKGRAQASHGNTLCAKHGHRAYRYGDPTLPQQWSPSNKGPETFECSDCGRLCATEWRRRTDEEIRSRTIQGSSGRCMRDYSRAVRNGTHIQVKRTIDAEEVLEEWEWMRDEGETVKTAAPRLGLKWKSLDKLLYRARKRGDLRGSTVPHAHDMRRAA